MSEEVPQHRRIEINGPPRVVPTPAKYLAGKIIHLFVLMGTTGSGKSSFIESLSSDNQLSISGDTLESVTQRVTTYRVQNLTYNPGLFKRDIILMDTPGFDDPRLSESRIIKMITSQLDNVYKSAADVAVSILYFHPINAVRMSGSKRKLVKFLTSFGAAFFANNINVVTSMWNLCFNPKQVREANDRLLKLRLDIYKNSKKPNIEVTKFDFTQDSALSVLDEASIGWFHEGDGSRDVDTQYESLAHDSLLGRIESVQQQLRYLEEQRQCALNDHDDLLLATVEKEEIKAKAALDAFSYDIWILYPESYQTLFPNSTSPPPALVDRPTTPSPSPPPTPPSSSSPLLPESAIGFFETRFKPLADRIKHPFRAT
ncbi:hypothetical protein BJ165DRAFT_1616648 [Panaeolus papilionaceus]|nr:hypothetical protein BJ165DRAFT_1616648 [Panaeolus papilionaceus]